jgi:hypothetical protein
MAPSQIRSKENQRQQELESILSAPTIGPYPVSDWDASKPKEACQQKSDRLPNLSRGGEVHMDARVFRESGLDLGCFVRAVVVHHQVQFLCRVAPGDVLKEGQELLARVRRFALSG